MIDFEEAEKAWKHQIISDRRLYDSALEYQLVKATFAQAWFDDEKKSSRKQRALYMMYYNLTGGAYPGGVGQRGWRAYLDWNKSRNV